VPWRKREKPETLGPEHNVREIILAGSSDLALHDLRPAAFEALGHIFGSPAKQASLSARVFGQPMARGLQRCVPPISILNARQHTLPVGARHAYNPSQSNVASEV